MSTSGERLLIKWITSSNLWIFWNDALNLVPVFYDDSAVFAWTLHTLGQQIDNWFLEFLHLRFFFIVDVKNESYSKNLAKSIVLGWKNFLTKNYSFNSGVLIYKYQSIITMAKFVNWNVVWSLLIHFQYFFKFFSVHHKILYLRTSVQAQRRKEKNRNYWTNNVNSIWIFELINLYLLLQENFWY